MSRGFNIGKENDKIIAYKYKIRRRSQIKSIYIKKRYIKKRVKAILPS